MKDKPIINIQRIRRIKGGFSFIPHRFLTHGFLGSLEQHELILYIFFVLAADRFGMSYYADESISKLTHLDLDELKLARNALLDRDLICFQDPFTQVLELPEKPVSLSSLRPENPIKSILNALKQDAS